MSQDELNAYLKKQFQCEDEKRLIILEKKIIEDINGEIEDSASDDEKKEMEPLINMPLKYIKFDLNKLTKQGNNFSDYEFWIKMAQKRMETAGVEAGLDYLRNGLRELPRSPQILYNYGCCCEELGWYKKAIRFF